MTSAGASSEDGGEPIVIDGGDLQCARLLVVLRDRVATLAPGTVVHLIARDPVAPIDLPAWCYMTGHVYLGPVDTGGDPTFAVEVSASARATEADRPWRPVAPSGPGA